MQQLYSQLQPPRQGQQPHLWLSFFSAFASFIKHRLQCSPILLLFHCFLLLSLFPTFWHPDVFLLGCICFVSRLSASALLLGKQTMFCLNFYTCLRPHGSIAVQFLEPIPDRLACLTCLKCVWNALMPEGLLREIVFFQNNKVILNVVMNSVWKILAF